jgi:hypothetical protein
VFVLYGCYIFSLLILSIRRLVSEAASHIENLQRSGKSRQTAWNASTVVLTWAAKVGKLHHIFIYAIFITFIDNDFILEMYLRASIQENHARYQKSSKKVVFKREHYHYATATGQFVVF